MRAPWELARLAGPVRAATTLADALVKLVVSYLGARIKVGLYKGEEVTAAYFEQTDRGWCGRVFEPIPLHFTQVHAMLVLGDSLLVATDQQMFSSSCVHNQVANVTEQHSPLFVGFERRRKLCADQERNLFWEFTHMFDEWQCWRYDPVRADVLYEKIAKEFAHEKNIDPDFLFVAANRVWWLSPWSVNSVDLSTGKVVRRPVPEEVRWCTFTQFYYSSGFVCLEDPENSVTCAIESLTGRAYFSSQPVYGLLYLEPSTRLHVLSVYHPRPICAHKGQGSERAPAFKTFCPLGFPPQFVGQFAPQILL